MFRIIDLMFRLLNFIVRKLVFIYFLKCILNTFLKGFYATLAPIGFRQQQEGWRQQQQ